MTALAPATTSPGATPRTRRARSGLSPLLLASIVLAMVTGLFVLYAFFTKKSAFNSDWQMFYQAAERWREGRRVYTVADGFFNPPPSLLLLRGFILLPYIPSRVVWGVLSTIMLFGSAWLTADAFGWRPSPRTLVLGAWWILVAVPTVLLAPVTGNWTAPVLLGYALALWLFSRGNEELAGAALVLTLVKPQLAFLTLPFLLYTRRWRALAGFLAVGAGLLLLSLPFVGLQNYQDYVSVQRAVANWTVYNDALQLDVPGIHGMLLQRWPHSIPASNVATLLSLAMIAGLAWYWRGPWQPGSPRFAAGWALLLLVTMQVSSFAHSYDLVLLIVPGVVLFGLAELSVPPRSALWWWARVSLLALYVGPDLVLLYRQHFMVPAMLLAMGTLLMLVHVPSRRSTTASGVTL